MDDGTHDMEQRFGHDFWKVRVHTDAQAAESAQAIDAYTVGSSVVLGHGAADSSSADTRRKLAHELVHVVQLDRSANDRTGRLSTFQPASALHCFTVVRRLSPDSSRSRLGLTVSVYNPATTVADCLKYRNKIDSRCCESKLSATAGAKSSLQVITWHL